MSHVEIARSGRVGRITLNRPAALNALTHAMVIEIHAALRVWMDEDEIAAVVVNSVGPRAFCAGGDIVMLYETGRTNPSIGRQFWRDEYRFNAAIAGYGKPYIAIIDGIVMGGGVGISAHGSHRIVSERSVVAMPEVTIGFLPDVGGTRLLSRSPGRIGEYLAATGARMSAADAIFAGFADYFVPSERMSELLSALETEGDPMVIERFAEPPPPSDLESHSTEIDAIFDALDGAAIMARLSGSTFAEKAAAATARNSPFSACCAIAAVRQARLLSSIEDCLTLEYRFAHRALDGHDFYEGIRAAVIDKDRAPKWLPPNFSSVDPFAVAAAFAPLGADEWTP
ncbi:MAG: enoyl-CoA hydratase/isomerase family protein [Dongiaceae bacterium]